MVAECLARHNEHCKEKNRRLNRESLTQSCKTVTCPISTQCRLEKSTWAHSIFEEQLSLSKEYTVEDLTVDEMHQNIAGVNRILEVYPHNEKPKSTLVIIRPGKNHPTCAGRLRISNHSLKQKILEENPLGCETRMEYRCPCRHE